MSSDVPAAAPSASAHLDAERLAALADEPPTAAESAHLASCAECREERSAYVALVQLARAEGASNEASAVYAGSDAPPSVSTGEWEALASALRAERLADDAAAEATGRPRRGPRWARVPGHRTGGGWSWAGRPARLAAGLLLAIGAAAAGRVSATRGPLAVAPTDGPGGADARTFASSEDARTVLARARHDYAQAAAFLAAADPGGIGADTLPAAQGGDGMLAAGGDAELLRARLAALDALLPRVRAAARQAPEDPAVNQLYLAAYDARETALRQLGRTLPAGVQLTGY